MSIVMKIIRGIGMVGRILCKDCGKVWSNEHDYKDDKGCDRGWCLHTDEGLMASRRRGRGVKPPHIEELIQPVVIGDKVPQVNLQVHVTSGPVFSVRDTDQPCLEILIPDCININIFPRKGFKS